MKPKSILITNDDGIHAEGIQLLSQTIFKNSDRYSLSIVAPDHERSAVGHAITMHRPLRVEKINFLHNPELIGWAVNGTPSDCVKLAVEAILADKPDLVISGINRGSNLGTDVLYSGTVSAAVEGLIMGIPSVAVSLTGGGDKNDFIFAARFICRLIPQLLEGCLPASTLININVPPGGDTVRGARVTTLGKRRYRNIFDKRVDPRGSIYYWLAGELVENDPEDADSDTRAVRDGYISVTPIQFNLTNRAVMPDLETMLQNIPIA
ncbi:MAG TPA: 5'/3'-nucleotidase SurE [Candidatus Limnocylindrales bacterium]|nr:5'/3'-nucleotidase SurE [Candidatus Limnocylindrales bacterium]